MQLTKDAEPERMKRIKRKIAVCSGKGGVGKTTIAAGLAVALARSGRNVGFLDADIDCPNAHLLFGVNEKGRMENGILQPAVVEGVRFMSMAMLVDEGAAIMWRGPMLTKALRDMLLLTDWGELDYLIIDMPPGTSDAAITVMQSIPDADFLIVTTAHKLARQDAERTKSMIEKMGRRTLGVVENMCSDVFGCSKDRNIIHVPLAKELSERLSAKNDKFDEIIRKIKIL